MKILFICLLFLAQALLIAAQDIKLVKSEKEQQTLAGAQLFHYPAFRQGMVHFRDGSSAAAPLNYHKLFEQMMFIDGKGDSLSIANPELIRLISIEEDTFYFTNNAYLQLVHHKGAVQIAQKQSLKEIDEKRTGAYGSTFTDRSDAFNNSNYKVAGKTANGKPRLEYAPNETYVITHHYFIAYRNTDFVPMDKKSVQALFPEQARLIKQFIKEHNTNFNSREEVLQLAQYIQSLK